MTISNSDRTAGPFIGNGATTSYPFGFKVFSRSDLLVAQTDASGNETILTLDSDYSVVLNSDQSSSPGGTATLSSALPTGYTLAMTSNIAMTQSLDLTNNGGFYPKTINDTLDRIVVMIQQVAAKVGGNLNIGGAAAIQTIGKLATSAGAALIGFIQGGTGARMRSIQDELRERVSVTQFGAKGDGVTDDTAAIVAAYNALVEQGGGILEFPNPANNVYCMAGDDTLRIRHSGIHIRGNGAAIKLLGTFAGTYSYFPTCAAQNGLIKIYAATDDVADFVENISIEGLRFLDTPTTDGSHCYNLTIQQARNVRITRCDFARASIGGIHVTGSQYQGATAAGIGSDYSYKLLYQTTGVSIDDCLFDGEGVQTPSLEGNIRVGIQIEGGALKTSVNNCRFKDCIKSSVREIGGIGTTISNPQIWTTGGTVNGNDITSAAWSWPAGQVGTSARGTDNSVMATSIGCKISNPNVQVHSFIGYDVQRSLETTITGGQIYNRNSALNFVAINGQNATLTNSPVGRVKAKRHKYVGVHTNGSVFFYKPAGEDATYQDVTDITVIGCAGWQYNVSGVVAGLAWASNNFQVFNTAVDAYPRLINVPSADPQSLVDGDYHAGSLVVDSYTGGKGNLSLVQVGGSVLGSFPAGVTGTSTGAFSFTTNNAAAFHAGMYVTANGAPTQISSVVPNTGDAGGTISTYNAIPAGAGFAVTVTAPTLDLPNAAAGTTAQRPTLLAWQAGFVYYDNTLNKPVFWSGASWVDSTGAAA